MKSMAVGKKLFVLFTTLLVLTAVLAWISLSALRSTAADFRYAVEHRNLVIELGNQLQSEVANLRSAQRALGLFAYSRKAPNYAKVADSFAKSVTASNALIDKLLPLTGSEKTRQQLEEVRKIVERIQGNTKQVMVFYAEGKPDEGVEFALKVSLFDAAFELTKDVINQQQQELQKKKIEIQQLQASTQWMVFGVLLLTVAAASFAVLSIRQISAKLRQISHELFAGAGQVTSAASQVSTSSQLLAEGASEQASSLEETSASTEEISSMTSQNSESAAKAAQVVGESNRQLAGANQKLHDMVTAMQEISGASDQVAKIIKVIDEIAFQTNILALNAAVEAARAGEAGMGFAVVADEVRNLAQRCAQAARDTQVLIESSVAKSAQGTQKVHELETSVVALTTQSAEVKTLVDEVSVGSLEQKRGLEQIAKAIGQMEQVTQKTAANAEESASAGQELNSQAEVLRGLVAELRRFVDGAAANAADS